mgnify:CR=1 FL=1
MDLYAKKMKEGEFMAADKRRILFDDLFDIFSMVIGDNYVTLYDIKTRITRYSPAIVEMLGLPGEYISDGVYDWMEYIHPEDRSIYETIMGEMLNLKISNYDLTYRVRTKDGSYTKFRYVGGVIRDEDRHPSIAGGMMIASGNFKQVDRATSLRNLDGFLEDLRNTEGSLQQLAVLLVGFGRLSHINERYGYSHGSLLLNQVGGELCKIVKNSGMVYRMEGSKFAIISHTLSPSDMASLYEKIRICFKKGIEVDGVRHSLIFYSGMVTLPAKDTAHDRTLYDCLQHACHESKNYRYGDLVSYNGNNIDDPDVSSSIAMIGEIRKSILNNFDGFYLLYEPFFSSQNSSPIGAEGLLRWKNERFGKVLSQEFLSEIERDYEFRKLAYWMYQKMMIDGRDFVEADPGFLLLLDVYPSQINDTYFADNLADLADAAGFPLSNLSLELTRECRLLEAEKLIRFTRSAAGKNIRIGIDDFGDGNAWLNTLRILNPCHVRFAGNLVKNVTVTDKDVIILSHLSDMVKACGINVFFKGIDTEKTKKIASRLNPDVMQGFVFSKPLYYDEVLEYYDSKNSDNGR